MGYWTTTWLALLWASTLKSLPCHGDQDCACMVLCSQWKCKGIVACLAVGEYNCPISRWGIAASAVQQVAIEMVPQIDPSLNGRSFSGIEPHLMRFSIRISFCYRKVQ